MIEVVLLFLVSLTILIVSFLNRKTTTSSSRLHNKLPPSPWAALPIIGHLHLLGPSIHRSFHRLSAAAPLLHLRLGSVQCVVVSTPDAAREVLRTHDLTFSNRKQTIAVRRVTYTNSSFAFAPHGAYWKFVKKLSASELLSPRMLRRQLGVRAAELRRFMAAVRERSRGGTERVNVTEELMTYSNNVISRMMLGSETGGGHADVARQVIREVSQIFGEFNVSDFVWCLRKFDIQGFKRRSHDIHRRYDELLESIIGSREQARKEESTRNEAGDEDDKVKDFLDVLLDVMEDDGAEIELTRDHIKALVLDFFTAGTDTTAATLDWSLAELINHPQLLTKARQEIDRVVGSDRLVQESDAPNLPYVQAIIKETFRLHPTIPMIARKSSRECHVNGYTIPTETLLFVNMWSIGRDPNNWPDRTLEFWPDRFVRSDVDITGQHFQLLPFGSGRRSCPGMPLALRQLPTVLAAMIQCFDWKVKGVDGGDAGLVSMDERPGLTVPRAHDLVCIPVARLPDII
ncbi:unnamed protein product [Linum trigynum]